jgi:hypothetical protein
MILIARLVASLCIILCLAGCAATPRTAPPKPRLKALRTTDWERVARDMVERIERRGILDEQPYRGPNGEPAIIAIGDFRNDTASASNYWNRVDALAVIEGELINSPKADVNMEVAGTGGTVDSLLAGIQELQKSPLYDRNSWAGGNARIPSLILWGRVSGHVEHDDANPGRWVSSYKISFRLIDTASRSAKLDDTTSIQIAHAR